MKNDYLKTYNFILEDERLDLTESILLCKYIEKFFLYNGCVIASDETDAKCLNIHYRTIGRKRNHLQEIGYIKCYRDKNGVPCNIQINSDIINKVKEINDKIKKSNTNKNG